MPNPPATGLPNPASYDTTSIPGVVIDNVTGLMWQSSYESAPPSVNAYCAGRSDGGFHDWRLPTEIELYSLVDYTQQDPAIDTSALPDILQGDASPDGYSSGFFLSSDFDPNSPYGSLGAGLLGVFFSSGNVGRAFQSTWVRCVRGPARSATLLDHYTIGNGTVTDNFTHLTWQRLVDLNAYAWLAAQNYCANLTLAGGGWRVPSIKELATLVDLEVPYPGPLGVEPAIDTHAFPNTPATQFWSSSPLVGQTESAWYVDFYIDDTWYGGGIELDNEDAATPDRVRCVR
jgi:Protein of unknown function (DUF1566)